MPPAVRNIRSVHRVDGCEREDGAVPKCEINKTWAATAMVCVCGGWGGGG